MLLSMIGMAFAAGGWLTPVAGAVAQEGIDLLAVLNALRTASASQADQFVPEAIGPGARLD
jgi:cation transport ATPase